ncbi:MAG: hypothetical protein ACYTHM_21995 [Planctomycetota bacterium]|jgi:hypothetical protein
MNWERILFVAVIAVILEILWQTLKFFYRRFIKKDRPIPVLGEIGPSHVLQKKYGLYAENAPRVRVRKKEVPEDLHDLIPLARKFGVGDDIIRGDIEKKASPEEKEGLKRALEGRTDSIRRWLDEFPIDGEMNDSAAAFLYLLEAHDEWAVWPK